MDFFWGLFSVILAAVLPLIMKMIAVTLSDRKLPLLASLLLYIRHSTFTVTVHVLLPFNSTDIIHTEFYRSNNDVLLITFAVSLPKFTSVERGNIQTRILLVLWVVSDMSEMSESVVRDFYNPATV